MDKPKFKLDHIRIPWSATCRHLNVMASQICEAANGEFSTIKTMLDFYDALQGQY